MNITEQYLEKLQAKVNKIFPKSLLSDDDLKEIENILNYTLPEEYKDFLKSLQIPEVTVYVSFCGNIFGCSYEDTFSKEENCYIPVDDDAEFVTVDFKLYRFEGENATDWLKHIKEYVGDMTAWLKAGFIPLGNFYEESEFVFYDLTTGEVLCIHHEDIYLTEEWENPVAARKCMAEEAVTLCRNFNDFLRLVCTEETYNEDEMIFEDL